MLGGLGFTVSPLIRELAFGTGNPHEEHVKAAVLAGSLSAAVLASVVLRLRNRVYRRIHAAENVDSDRDGVPDVYAPAHKPEGDHPAHTRRSPPAQPLVGQRKRRYRARGSSRQIPSRRPLGLMSMVRDHAIVDRVVLRWCSD